MWCKMYIVLMLWGVWRSSGYCAKKMKLLTLHTYDCPWASLKDCSSSSDAVCVLDYVYLWI